MKSTKYKKYLTSQLGLTEAQFIPSSTIKKEDFPGTEEPNVSPTAKPTPIIALGIRGSTTGGLPSGADQTGQDISPTKVGGYDRVSPQNLNHHTFDKTPSNPEIKQETDPVNQNPSTGQGVTHPHQIQVTAHEEPQSVTGASTDSDPTLKLKSAVPKGIDIDIAETGNTEKAETKETNKEDNDNAMIPSTSLSETFERHKRLMRERMGFQEAKGKCPCGCEGTCQCPPDCKCKKNKNGVCECATCGCGDPNDDHKHEEEENMEEAKARVCFHCKKPHPCDCDKKDEDDAKLQRKNPEEYRKRFGMKIDKRSDLDPRDRGETVECKQCHNRFNYRLVSEVAMGAVQCPACDAVLDQSGIVLAEGKHKAGCQCGFCKNKGSFGKKKKVEEEGGGDDPEFKEKDEKQWRKDRSASKAGDDVRDELDKDKKKKVNEQQRLDESYAAPFQRMRSLAGVGNMILTSNGLMENKNDPGANKPFNTHWKMDKEKAGFVKVDEEKLNKVKATLQRKSKRGSLSDKELQLAKKLDEVLKRRKLNEGGFRTDDDYPHPRANETPAQAEVRLQNHRRNTNPATQNNPASGESADDFEDRKRERDKKDRDTRGY